MQARNPSRCPPTKGGRSSRLALTLIEVTLSIALSTLLAATLAGMTLASQSAVLAQTSAR